MNLTELIKEVSKNTKTSRADTNKIVRETFKVLTESVVFGHRVQVPRLGAFEVVPTKETRGVFNGKPIIRKRKFRLKFFISKELKKKIDAKKIY